MGTAGLIDIRVKRAYRAVRMSDGQRVLVDAIWPRGVSRERIRIDCWMKSIAPSPELRRWFGHDPEKWPQFRLGYFRELDGKAEEVAALSAMVLSGTVTLVYGAKDEAHNNAVALRDYIQTALVGTGQPVAGDAAPGHPDLRTAPDGVPDRGSPGKP